MQQNQNHHHEKSLWYLTLVEFDTLEFSLANFWGQNFRGRNKNEKSWNSRHSMEEWNKTLEFSRDREIEKFYWNDWRLKSNSNPFHRSGNRHSIWRSMLFLKSNHIQGLGRHTEEFSFHTATSFNERYKVYNFLSQPQYIYKCFLPYSLHTLREDRETFSTKNKQERSNSSKSKMSNLILYLSFSPFPIVQD